jgi:hypothetical protein
MKWPKFSLEHSKHIPSNSAPAKEGGYYTKIGELLEKVIADQGGLARLLEQEQHVTLTPPSRVHVSHKLVIECVVAEEMYHEKGGQYQTCGDPLKLRMLFPILVLESQGMGISWDEEIPPRYEDVTWNAPPTFAQSERFTDAALQESMDDMETLEGIQRVMSPSPPTLHGPSSGEFSSFGDRLSPIDSDSGAVST